MSRKETKISAESVSERQYTNRIEGIEEGGCYIADSGTSRRRSSVESPTIYHEASLEVSLHS